MAEEKHKTEYDFDSNRQCFDRVGDRKTLEIHKEKNGPKHKLLVHNRSSFKRLDFHYVVLTAKRKPLGGSWQNVPLEQVDPFTERERRGMAGAGTAATYEVRKQIFEDGDKIDITGKFEPENGCPHQTEAIRVHTDWHIEC